ncbi:16S rRNA (guanine(527)-N(7))-methyltransferase RsmG [Actinosynnema pretiosum subsp. pretiosum]|uniref:Ribosomal RNA small subunit methyltransferase G n=2 Tax=Actinosynnema TaxID=40566 RepID=C6WSL4_ACTMD|nr:16S rRNA (guanine(527)-N(7))-methyltransferase RsmG [Actinosynnema mirum]ACU40884.1 methyltransferase GidB [Actinosynnema mirum DSM 43827]AXX34397.1 rRNA small subunit 7-methylguanosine (m7G) methyltransferase GidB [Actinosynnema pretiosum subsp. pretiosum]QUF01911.1 16S rRNA (guanine(527)-N(7))-methyltransferase RsmG [Actinosynnema pretiosum subsp. pretiosum]
MTGEVDARVERVFGEHSAKAVEFTAMLTEHGVERGLIGPREVDRLWERHVLNSAVVAELLPQGSKVVDVGSGAGLPGIPLAIARPDLELVLLEPMARRVAWLTEVVDALGLQVEVVRGRAEEGPVRKRLADRDVVTARAVAPLERLAGWCLPLLRPGGHLVALKGESAQEEIDRDAEAVRRAGGVRPRVASCGGDVLDVPTTLVVVERAEPAARKDRRAKKAR